MGSVAEDGTNVGANVGTRMATIKGSVDEGTGTDRDPEAQEGTRTNVGTDGPPSAGAIDVLPEAPATMNGRGAEVRSMSRSMPASRER